MVLKNKQLQERFNSKQIEKNNGLTDKISNLLALYFYIQYYCNLKLLLIMNIDFVLLYEHIMYLTPGIYILYPGSFIIEVNYCAVV